MSSSQNERCVTENVRGEDVDKAHDEDCDTATDDQAPECHAKRFLGRIGFVEVCKHAITEEELSCTEHDEAGLWTEERPIACEI